MRIREALSKGAEVLMKQRIAESLLEAEVLLRHSLKWSQVRLYANLNQELTADQFLKFDSLIQRRIHHEPTAYILKHKEFFGIDFYVDQRVLIPRPETELLVEKTLELADNTEFCIVDVGTGCGAIAIALALRLPNAKIYATDISSQALEVARMNITRHKVSDQVHLLEGDLLRPVPISPDLIVANLPYIRNSEMTKLSPEIRLFEPLISLSGGSDGLREIKRLLRQAKSEIHPKKAILLEIAPHQNQEVVNLVHHLFPDTELEVFQDLSGQDRVVNVKT
jgi:release factor glutamine methyltransferase